MYHHTVQLLQGATVDHVCPHHGREVPHVVEGDQGELTAPVAGQRDGAQEGEEFVAASLAAVEAAEGRLEAERDGVTTLRLRDHILELNLKCGWKR